MLTLYAICGILLFWLEGRCRLYKQMFWEFLCIKMYKNNCLNCLKIYVRIFIQCININCRNFQIIQKTWVLYRFNSLNFSEVKWKGVKCVFLYSAGIYIAEMLKKNWFFLFFCEKVFWILKIDFEKIWLIKVWFFLFCFNKLKC